MPKELHSQNPKIQYDVESDVLSWEISKEPIDNAVEMGNMVVHFNPNNSPVLVEILEARRFFAKAKILIQQKVAAAV